METIDMVNRVDGDNEWICVDAQGSLFIRGLLQLFELYCIPPDAGLYICDPTDPDKRYIIKRVEEKEDGQEERVEVVE